MLDFVEKFKDYGHSQNGEMGILKEVLKRLKIKKGTAVEFGAADGLYLSNTADLKGWKRLLFDINPQSDEVVQANIGPYNVNELVPHDIDVLSIDVDGDDYNIWKAYGGKSKVVIIEINSDYKPGVRIMNKGTTYTPMVELGIEKGYFLLAHTGNVIFILNEYRNLFPEIIGDGLTNADEYFNRSWLKPFDGIKENIQPLVESFERLKMEV